MASTLFRGTDLEESKRPESIRRSDPDFFNSSPSLLSNHSPFTSFGMFSRKKNKAINYAEVDSDVDLDSEGEEEERQVGVASSSRRRGDTYGATTKPSKKNKKRKSTSNRVLPQIEEPQALGASSKLLLGVPFDLFAEFTNHLEGTDMISLGKVNKALHKLIAVNSSTKSSIWSQLLRRDGFELIPKDLSEIAFAILIYSPLCQACGNNAQNDPNLHLRVHLCRECFGELIISKSSATKNLKNLHSEAINCVRFFERTRNTMTMQEVVWKTLCVKEELEAISRTLYEFEDEEENLKVSSVTQGSPTASSRRSRLGFSTSSQAFESLVARVVEQRRGWVDQEQEASERFDQAYRSLSRALCEPRWALRRARNESTSRRYDMLRNDYGWSQEEIYRYSVTHRDVDHGQDSEAWNKLHEVVKKIVVKEARKAQQTSDRQARKFKLLTEVYYPLRSSITSKDFDVYPTETEFMDLPSVYILWYPLNTTFNRQVAREALLKIEEEIKSIYNDRVRVQTSRALVSANEDLNFSETSNDPADYPPSSCNETFFSLATSLFTNYRDENRPRQLVICQYPSTSAFTFRGASSFQFSTNFRQIKVIKAILEAAGLDPEYATLGDLDSMEGDWIWTNHPQKTKRRDTFDWFSLLAEALLRAPTAPQLRSGKVVRIKYVPTTDEE